MSMVSEFKAFIARGNVLDLAVAVIIAAAFGKIVTALVDGIIMPIVGLVVGGVDFSQLFVALDGNDYANLAAAQEAAAPVITYGAFIQTIIDFLLIAFVIFMIVKAYNRMIKKEEAAPAAPAEEVLLLREIRDSLKRPGV
ncbi:large conductance mechanosensitive channel protein MscL [Lysobacter sp. F60174L2]|uniref:large conductance mechanosensitive channel protein MscL n=1 Tax=Lysobacter sp. F60174L2 TaxID=3459295 RepID=UPI00403D9C39